MHIPLDLPTIFFIGSTSLLSTREICHVVLSFTNKREFIIEASSYVIIMYWFEKKTKNLQVVPKCGAEIKPGNKIWK